MLTDRELQDLRNIGNEAEMAASELVDLRQDAERLHREREVLARWIAEACGVLFSMEEETEDGGEALRTLRERGQRLFRAVLVPPLPEQAAALQRLTDNAQELGLEY